MTDLIAVTALFLLGLALLLPTVAKLKQQSAAIKCLNNTRVLALASQLYAGDNRDFWPANGNSDPTLDLLNPPPSYVPRVWAEGREIFNFTGRDAVDASISPKFSLLANYVSDKRAFLCPADAAPLRFGNITIWRPRSYGMNIFVGWPTQLTVGATWFGEPNNASQSYTKIFAPPAPADIFLFGEIHRFSICQPAFGTHPSWNQTGEPTGRNLSFHIPANFHGQASTFSMVDGHAELHRWINPRFNDPFQADLPIPEGDAFWHNHNTPLPGVTAPSVLSDYKWLSLHASRRK